MRILILTPDIYTRGGIARYSSTLASALGGLAGPNNIHVLPLLGIGQQGEGPGHCCVLKPVADRINAPNKIRFVCKAMRLGMRKYDLVIATHVGLSPVAAMLRGIFGTPFWVACHGSESWRKFPPDVRWALRDADLVLPVSRFTADMVVRMNGLPCSRLHVLHNAIPDGFGRMLMAPRSECGLELQPTRRVRTILSVGMVSRALSYKGFDTVIGALPRVLDRVPDARYVIAGDGDDIGRLKQLARETGVRDYVEFRGTLSDSGLAECYRACDVFILPSRAKMSPPCEGEGFGRVYIEAALAGKPVVGSKAGGAEEAVLHQKTGLLVNPDSPSEVADALIYILENPAAATSMGREARCWALINFTSEALQRQLKELLRNYGLSPNPAMIALQGAPQSAFTIETESCLSADLHVS
jgi:phosphatidylinositol alpha-1,6-mannosyltransferase